MAMRRPTGGAARRFLPPVYEDFQPPSELKQEDGAHKLQLSLPGFIKEQIKVSVDTASSILKVEGRRLLGGNNWKRFRAAFPIPADAKTEEIHAKFESGKLYVTMPKKITAAPPTGEPKRETQQAHSPEKPTTGPIQPQEVVETPGQKPTPAAQQAQRPPVPEKPTGVPIQPQGAIEIPERKPTGTAQQTQRAPSPEKPTKAPVQPLEAIETLGSKPTPTAQRTPSTEKPTTGPILPKEVVEAPGPVASPTAQQSQRTPSPEKPTKSPIQPQEAVATQGPGNDIVRGAKKEGKEREESDEKLSQPKSQEDKVKGDYEEAAKKSDFMTTVRDTAAMASGGKEKVAERYKQVVRDVSAAARDGDRQLLVNAGAAALVLMAFGAYISYGLWSSGNAKWD